MTLQCMGSIDRPITRYTNHHIYRRDAEMRYELEPGLELYGVPNSSYTFVMIDDTKDSIEYRAAVAKRLGTEVFWFCPAPMTRMHLMTPIYFTVGLILIILGGLW